MRISFAAYTILGRMLAEHLSPVASNAGKRGAALELLGGLPRG